MKTIQIQTAENGYIANESVPRDMNIGIGCQPYVFESFESLTKWLRQQLEKPKEPKIGAVAQ